MCSEGYLHLDSNHHRQEFLFQFPKHCQFLQSQATQPARHRVPMCSILPRYTAQLPGQHSCTWVSYERLDGNTREETWEANPVRLKGRRLPAARVLAAAQPYTCSSEKMASHPGLPTLIPCRHLHEAGMNSPQYPLRYMETSSAYLGAAPEESPGSPAGLCAQLWEATGLLLTIRDGWYTLKTCKLSLFGKFLCNTFIPEQTLEKYWNEATAERWLPRHHNQKTQLAGK